MSANALYTRSVLIIIAASLQATYNASAEQMGWGAKTFAHPLYPKGGPYTVPTAYVCRTLMQEAVYEALQQEYAADIAAGSVHIFDFTQVTYQEALAQLGLADAPLPAM